MHVSDEHTRAHILSSQVPLWSQIMKADLEENLRYTELGFRPKRGKTEFRVAKKRRTYTVLESTAWDEKNSARGLHSDGNVELRAVRLCTANVQNSSSS